MRTVYADAVFISNFCFDTLLLYLSGRFLRKRIGALRLVMSSALGSLFALVIGILSYNAALNLLLSLLFLPVMTVFAFGRDTYRNVVRRCLTMLAFSFVLCGILMLVYQVFCCYLKNVSLTVIQLSAIALTMLFCIMIMNVFYNRIVSRSVKVMIENNGNAREYTMLCDSGNCLIDPYVGLPMIILKESKKKELVDDGVKLRLVPYRTVTGGGLSEAFTPQRVYVGKKSKQAVVCFAEDENISSACGDGIIPSYLLE